MNKIYVTKPSIPPLDDFYYYLKDIWESGWLTNNGKYHQEFEKKLSAYLGQKYISLFSNGTLALITALRSLEITGEVITTPYSFVATTHSLHWNRIKPVFVDIDENTFNLNPEKIKSAITSKTTAILPVHVYGIPCEVEEIQQIACNHGLKVIYDAAHAFSVKYKNKSVLSYGDLSILSFHATKIFNTAEGGAIICHDEQTKQKIDYLKNFGIKDEVTVVSSGINAKMNELQAALGILQLEHINNIIQKCKSIFNLYKTLLKDIPGLRMLKINENIEYNYSYFPLLIYESEYGKSRDGLYNYLKLNNIYTRKYFYPLISQFPPYKKLISAKEANLPKATSVSKNIICLPIYADLTSADVRRISRLIKDFQRC